MSKKNDPIDYDSALERTGGDEQFLKELLAIYDEEFLSNLNELQNAVKHRDHAKIKEIGHSLKGSSGNLSLNHLQETSFKIEKAGEAQDAAQAENLIADLKKEYENLKEFISE